MKLQRQHLVQLHHDLDEACRVGDVALAQSILERMLDVVPEVLADEPVRERPLVWNNDPAWVAYCATLETLAIQLAAKYTRDEGLRECCAQEARIAIRTTFPERVRGHGTLDGAAWDRALRRYCATAMRNAVLSYLDPVKTGNWYIGRKRRVRNRKGERVKAHVGPRYSSLDKLVSDHGLQIDQAGNKTWAVANTGGLGPMDPPDTGEAP
jgi:hypothetical protein